MLTRTQDQCDAMQRSGKFPVPDWQRAGGDCVCEACGHKYYDHPQHIPYYQLHVLCDGRYVKL